MLSRLGYGSVWLALFFCSLSVLAGQLGDEGQQRLRFRHFTIDQGFPDHSATAMIQDHNGFLWVATSTGLSRFDGRNFVSWTHDVHNATSLSHNWVNVLYQDRAGILWVGTRKGLNYMLPDGTGFRHFFAGEAGTNSLPGSNISWMIEDKSGLLWVATNRGLCSYDRRADQFFPLAHDAENPLLPAGNTYVMAHGPRDKLWLGTRQGICLLDPLARKVERFSIKAEGSEREPLVTCLFSRSEDELWVGTASQGLIRVTPSTGEVYHLPLEDGQSSLDWIYAILEEGNQFWIGSYGNGLHLYDLESGDLLPQRHLPGDPGSLNSDEITCLFKDTSGLVWVGTYGGSLSLWNPLARVFDTYRHIPGNENSLDDNVVWQFIEGDEDTLWISTDSGLNKWSYGSNRFEHFRHDPNDPQSISQGAIWHLERADANHLWLISADGLDYFDMRSGKARRFSYDPDDPKSLPPYTLISATAAPDGTVYIASDGGGLIHFDKEQGVIEHFKRSKDNPEGINTNAIKCLIRDGGDGYWIASSEGLLHFDPGTKRFVVHGESLDGHGVSDENINRLYRSENGTLWIGTSGGGVNRMTPAGNFSYYTHRDGLPSDSIMGIIEDLQGYIWISTARGLSRLNPQDDTIRNFNFTHGLQSNEINEGSAFRDSLGRLYFGGGKGFNVFDPEAITASSFVPPVRITSIRAFNRPMDLPVSYPDVTELAVSWKDTVISFEFAALDFANPRGTRYMYQMEGFNHDWIDLGERNSETFTNLKPGRYVFKVKGSNRDGSWSDQVTEVKLFIETPPWQSVWAYAGYLLAIGLIFWLWFRSHKRKLEARREAHEALQHSEERLKHALWGTGDELWDLNLTSGFVHRSNMLDVRGDGGQYNNLEGIYRAIHPDDADAVRQAVQRHLDGEAPYYEAHYRLPNNDGSWEWVLDRGRVVEWDARGNPLRMAGTNKNINNIKETEEKLRLIAKAFENTSDGVMITDHQFKVVAINPAYKRITGYSAKDTDGSDYEPKGEHGHDDKLLNLIREALHATGHWEGELWQEHKKGGRFPVATHIDAVYDHQRQVTHYVCVVTDITYMKQAEEKLRRLANYDQLTQLPNRNLFLDRLSHALVLAERKRHKVALLFLDLDRFKNINDSLGHAAGDELLQEVALRVRGCLREVDSVARLGGDEFTVILEGVENPADVAGVAEKVLRRMDKPFVLSGQEMVISPSIGISLYPDDGNDTETLLKCADTAMYHAKREGRNNYQFFTNEMNLKVVERLSLESEMRRGLERDEFMVFYQPKLETQASRIIGWEALIRWQHPTDGLVSPARFIPVAEESGLIIALGRHVMYQACRQAADWLTSGLEGSKIAVNLSALQFRQANLVDQVTTILAETGLPPEYLELEITEGTLLNDIEHAIDVLLELRELGVNISLDDFGTGFSSLAYLKRLPIHRLKIDRSFVRDLYEGSDDAAIVGSIIDLAHSLNLGVVAEGVETAEQLAFLQDRNCEQVQGFYFSKPIPAPDATNLLSMSMVRP